MLSSFNRGGASSELPVGPLDVVVPFPSSCNPKLPIIYITPNHPLKIGKGTAYFFIYNGLLEGPRATYELEVNELKIPQGPHDEAIQMGFLELLPGDIIFSRLRTDPVSGVNDVPVLWVTGGDIYSEELKLAALRARDCALGDRSKRTRGHATPDPSKPKAKVGGTAWERSLPGKFDPSRGRCYPFGCTFQKQRALYSPCAAGKVSITNTETLKMRKDLTNSTLEMAMISLKQGPQGVVEAIQLNHELLNTPCVGTENNFVFTSNQINLAHSRIWDSSETLADNMGMKFGGAHIDQNDSPGHFTNMISLSDLPRGTDPGQFFIVFPGVFCTLHNFVSVNFSGLRVHGGSPPIAASDATAFEKQWATRCTVVAYAKTGPTSTEHKMPLMQMEPNVVLSINPEMLRPERFVLDKKFKVDATNFVVEGPTVMTSSAVMEFLVRCFLMLVLTMISQLPSSFNVKVDTDAFLGSFYYTDEHGTACRVGPWLDGPGWRNNLAADNRLERSDIHDSFAGLEDQTEYLSVQRRRWNEHLNKCGAHIPSALCCVPGITPLEGWSPGNPLLKIRPLPFRKGKDKETTGDSSCEDKDPPANAKNNKPRSQKKSKGNKGNNPRRTLRPDPDPLPDELTSPEPENESNSDDPDVIPRFPSLNPDVRNSHLSGVDIHSPRLNANTTPSPDLGFGDHSPAIQSPCSWIYQPAMGTPLSVLFPGMDNDVPDIPASKEIRPSVLGKRPYAGHSFGHTGLSNNVLDRGADNQTDKGDSSKRQAMATDNFAPV